MTPTLTAPKFAADVLAFAAEHGVGDYLTPLYELAKSCFDGADMAVRYETDPDVADLSWICFEVAVADWDAARFREAKSLWTDEFVQLPPAAREAFVLGVG